MAQALKPGYDFCTVDSFDGQMPGLDRLAIAMVVETGPLIRCITKDRFRDHLRTGCPGQKQILLKLPRPSASGWLQTSALVKAKNRMASKRSLEISELKDSKPPKSSRSAMALKVGEIGLLRSDETETAFQISRSCLSSNR